MSENMLIDEYKEILKIEIQNLNNLKTTEQQCKANTSSIINLLSEFDDRLTKLEQDIQPVYKETGNLQLKQAELVKTLERLDHVIQYYEVVNDVNDIIQVGPTGQLETYMQSLKRLKMAIQYFSQNNPDSPEYQNVKLLFKYGCEAVEKEFKLTLQRYSLPIAPITLQDIVDDDGSEQLDSTNSAETADTSGSFRRHQPDVPNDKIEDLRMMCDWLCYNCNEELINMYADIRSDYILKSLKSLQEFRKSQSGPFGIINSSSVGGSSGPSLSSRGSVDSPDMTLNKKRLGPTSRDLTKRTSKSIQLAFKKRLHNVIPGDVMTHKLDSSSIDDITISEREIVIYLTCLTAFHKLAVMELKLMSRIVPIDLKVHIYNRLIQESLRFIANEANNLTIRVKKSTSKNDFMSALNLFPILRYQALRRHNFDLLFDGCQSEALNRFQGLTITFQTTISKSLDEFATYVENYGDIKLPGDGTVHELTNNVMIFIEQLHPHLDIMSSVIPIRDMQAMEESRDKNRLGFAQYILRLLDSLDETIRRRAESYANQQLIYLFKLNNYHYILKRLREYCLIEIVQTYKENVEQYYEIKIEDTKNDYLRRVSPVVSHLVDTETRNKSTKERFAGFNKDFQELHRLNMTYAVPDLELRTHLRESCKDLISSYYRPFYRHFAEQDFSKNKEKYLKFTPEVVECMIDQFFESN